MALPAWRCTRLGGGTDQMHVSACSFLQSQRWRAPHDSETRRAKTPIRAYARRVSRTAAPPLALHRKPTYRRAVPLRTDQLPKRHADGGLVQLLRTSAGFQDLKRAFSAVRCQRRFCSVRRARMPSPDVDAFHSLPQTCHHTSISYVLPFNTYTMHEKL